MSKYDFGYEIVPNSTIKWAYERIESGTTVLELGPANGNLVYHLSNEKGCLVDIVEIDEEAGKQAARYSRNSCLGEVKGNLEKNEWFNILKGNQYDYIVILDVLEHIRNPKDVLEKLGELLKTDGYILLSIPNIAHNSIILGLLKDRFEYTDVGLLDDTHVHFYTYASVKQLLNRSGLVTVEEQVKQEQVGQNEITVSYGDLPQSVESYLKTKETGTAYQYLFTIQKGDTQADIKIEYNRTYDRMYEVVVFDADSSKVISKEAISPKDVNEVEVDIPASTKRIRIDPLNANCVISNLNIKALTKAGQLQEVEVKEFTGISNGSIFAFFDDDPQIYIEIPIDTQTLKFSCEYLFFDNEALTALVEFRDVFRQDQNDLEELKLLFQQRENIVDELQKDVSEQEEQLASFQVQLNQREEQLASFQVQLSQREEQLVECQVQLGRQEEQLNMCHVQRGWHEEQLAEYSSRIKEQNLQLSQLADALRISSENLQESESRRARRDKEFEDLMDKLNEQQKIIESLNSELWNIQKTLWGKVYYKLKKD